MFLFFGISGTISKQINTRSLFKRVTVHRYSTKNWQKQQRNNVTASLWPIKIIKLGRRKCWKLRYSCNNVREISAYFPYSRLHFPSHEALSSSKISALTKRTCLFCGGKKHARSLCPAKKDKCFICSNLGHVSKASRNKVMLHTSSWAILGCQFTTTYEIKTNEKSLYVLVDKGSTENFIAAKKPILKKKLPWLILYFPYKYLNTV